MANEPVSRILPRLSAPRCARHPSRWIPFDETRRCEFFFGGRRNSSRCASTTPSFRCKNHAKNIRPRSRRCAAQRGSESLYKIGELRAIVRKPGFVRKSGCKLLKTNWFGRGGGDRTHAPPKLGRIRDQDSIKLSSVGPNLLAGTISTISWCSRK